MPGYIAEECIRRKIPYKLYWVCSNPALPFPKELNLVPPNTAAFVYHMATAGCWVDTTRKLYYFKKKKNQTYIHTWHAGPGLKKIERDAGSGLTDKYVRYAQRDSKAIDLRYPTADSGPSASAAASGMTVRSWRKVFQKMICIFRIRSHSAA